MPFAQSTDAGKTTASSSIGSEKRRRNPKKNRKKLTQQPLVQINMRE
jgi:hypothetical protein